jgi:hypothetical protein
MNAYTPNIHALSGILTHDPSVRVKTVHALDSAATVTGTTVPLLKLLLNQSAYLYALDWYL